MKKIIFSLAILMLVIAPTANAKMFISCESPCGGGGGYTPPTVEEPTDTEVSEPTGFLGGGNLWVLLPRFTGLSFVYEDRIEFMTNQFGRAYLVFDDGEVVYDTGISTYHTIYTNKSGYAQAWYQPEQVNYAPIFVGDYNL